MGNTLVFAITEDYYSLDKVRSGDSAFFSCIALVKSSADPPGVKSQRLREEHYIRTAISEFLFKIGFVLAGKDDVVIDVLGKTDLNGSVKSA